PFRPHPTQGGDHVGDLTQQRFDLLTGRLVARDLTGAHRERLDRVREGVPFQGPEGRVEAHLALRVVNSTGLPVDQPDPPVAGVEDGVDLPHQYHRGRGNLVLQRHLPLLETLGGEPAELPVEVPDLLEQRLQVGHPPQIRFRQPEVQVRRRPDLLAAGHHELVVRYGTRREVAVEDEMRQRSRHRRLGVRRMEPLQAGLGAPRAPFPGLERRSRYAERFSRCHFGEDESRRRWSVDGGTDRCRCLPEPTTIDQRTGPIRATVLMNRHHFLFRVHPLLAAVLVVGALSAALLALYGLTRWVSAGEVMGRVVVGDVSLGGLQEAEAERELADLEERLLTRRATFSIGGSPVTLDPPAAGLNLDVEGMTRNAMSVGREGNAVYQFLFWLTHIFSTVEIPVEGEVDDSALDAVFDQWDEVV